MKTSRNHIKELQKYINEDTIYQDFCKGKEPAHNDGCTDFEWFCIRHCEDIEWVLNELKKERNVWKQNRELQLCHMTFINDLDTILMLLKEQPTKNNIKNIIKLIKSTRDKLMEIYSE